tara:strand:- start:658 stop:1200 length:543 start_codon:yes stop_codon:yes gene_type:complete
MNGWLYLIRNRDLYKIGITKNFEKRMQQLKPDSVVAKLYSRDFLKLERELHNRYKQFRIPQTEYFRLNVYHVNEIKQRVATLEYPISMILDIFIKSLIFTLLIFTLLLITISLTVNDIDLIIIESLLWMERILFVLSFISLFLNSDKYLNFFSELKYRITRLIVYIVFACVFRMVSFFLI